MNILKRIFANPKQVPLKHPIIFGSSHRKKHYGKEYAISLKDWEQQEPKRCYFNENGKFNIQIKNTHYAVKEESVWNFEVNEDQEIVKYALLEVADFNGIKLDAKPDKLNNTLYQCSAIKTQDIYSRNDGDDDSRCISNHALAGLLWCYLEALSIVYSCALDSTSAGIGIALIVPKRKISQELWSYINVKFEYIETKKGIFLIRPLPGVALDYPFPDPRLILYLPRQLMPEDVCIGNVILPLIAS